VANRSVWLERLVVAAVLLLIVWGIGSYGIWDPWELSRAEAARLLSEGAGAPEASLSTRLMGASFDAFGVREWSGRLPGVLAGLLTCVLAFVLVREAQGRRAAVTALAVLASTPAFLLNVRLLMGAAVGLAAQSWVGVAAIGAMAAGNTRARMVACCVLLAAGVMVSTFASGVLLGPLPPVLAMAVWSVLAERGDRPESFGRWLFPAAAAVFVAGIARAVTLDAPGPSLWLGGGAVGGNPRTYDEAFELLFHGLAPWSAALPVALVWSLAPRPGKSDSVRALAPVLVLWSAFGFASWTLFASRYGNPPFLALLPLSALVAMWLYEVSDEPVALWPAAVIVALLIGLLMRDYALYPESPLRALAVEDLSIPEVYDPKRWWALLFTIAGLAFSLFLVSHEGVSRPCPRRMARWLRTEWESGGAPRFWMLLGGALLAACFVFGSICIVLDLRIPSVAARIGRVLFFVPFILAALVLGMPWLRYGYGKLRAAGVFPVLASGLFVGGFLVFSFQPALTQHFSPKPLYDAYGALTEGRKEPLAVYRSPATAANHYASVSVEEIDAESDLLAYLREGGQRWVVMPSEHLPRVDRAYRRQTGRHLYVADGRSARLLLVGAVPVEGRPNASFLEATVRSDVGAVQHLVGARFDDRIELVGYDLRLPGGDSVGAGQRFEVTWHWRAIGDPPAGYTVFVHIDGHGLRLNGDHEPVDGRYPTKLWDEGDVIVDTHELFVPANFPRGDYEIYVGWFSGKKRLEVRSGPQDGDNRLRAGILPVR